MAWMIGLRSKQCLLSGSYRKRRQVFSAQTGGNNLSADNGQSGNDDLFVSEQREGNF